MGTRIERETLYLKYEFDDKEKLAMANTLAANHNRLQDVEAEEAVFKAQIKDRKAGIEQSIQSLSRSIYTGWEMRNIPCRVQWDSPNVNEVTYSREDTGEIVKSRPMSEVERQQELEFANVVEMGPKLVKDSAANIESFFGEGSIDALKAEDAGNSAQEEEDEERDIDSQGSEESEDAVFANPDPAAAAEAIKPEHDAAWSKTDDNAAVKRGRGRPAGSKNKATEIEEPF